MWPRLRKDDIMAVVYYLGLMVVAIAIAMLVPLAVALVCREWNAAIDLLLSFGVTLTIGALMRLMRPRTVGLTRVRALVITGLAWIAAALVSAMPFVVGGFYTSFFDAVFDAVSCYTGTGMSMVVNLAHLPYSLNLWRFIMVIIGAQGIVLVALGLGTISKFSGAGLLFEAEGHQDQIMPRMATTSRFIALFLGACIVLGTAVCSLICYLLCGFSPLQSLYHGFCLAASGVATGGISVMDMGVAYYHQPLLNAVLMVFMLAGIFSFAVYYRMISKGPRVFFKDIETRMFLLWAVVVLVVASVAFAYDANYGDLGIYMDKGVFNVVSALTGTGFCTLSSSQLTSVATPSILFCLILGMAMGGATSSTAGGPKAIRMALVFKSIASEVRRVLLPNKAREVIRYEHLGPQVLTPELSRNAMLVFLLFLLTYIVGSIVGVLCGYDPMAAVLESVSCTNNCGISSGICGASLPIGLKATYLVQMLAGRLEFVALLATLSSIVVSAAYGAKISAAGRLVAGLVPDSVRDAWRGHGEGGGPAW